MAVFNEIERYFERNADLHVLFIFDQMHSLETELSDRNVTLWSEHPYMHRMSAYTVEQIRSKYLLPHIEWLKNHIAEMEARASQLTTQERRQKDQMVKDLKECLEYHD